MTPVTFDGCFGWLNLRRGDAGTTTLFLFSPGEVAGGAFALEFGPTGEGLAAYKGAAMRVIPDMDHDLTAATGRLAAEALIVDYFSRA